MATFNFRNSSISSINIFGGSVNINGKSVTEFNKDLENLPEVSLKESFFAENIRNLEVKVDSIFLTIETSSTLINEIVITASGKAENFKLNSLVNGEKLVISPINSGISQDLKVKVFIPEKFSFKDVSLKIESGNISIDSILASSNIRVDMNSGNLKMNSINTPNIDISMVSGNCNINDIKADILNLKMDSGNMSANYLNLNRIKINMDSGTLKMTNVECKKEISGYMYSGISNINLKGARPPIVNIKKDSGFISIN